MSTMWPTLGSLDVPKARTRKKDADVKTEARKRFLASFGQSDLPGFRIQCFSYRRFFASPDASSLIWTQVERFGRFFQVKLVQFSMRLLRVEPPKSKSKYSAEE